LPPVGFEPKISAGEQPKTYSLDRTATGTGFYFTIPLQNMCRGKYVLRIDGKSAVNQRCHMIEQHAGWWKNFLVGIIGKF
jgi:hypothetical protein